MSRGVQAARRIRNRFTPEFNADAVRMMQAGTKSVAKEGPRDPDTLLRETAT